MDIRKVLEETFPVKNGYDFVMDDNARLEMDALYDEILRETNGAVELSDDKAWDSIVNGMDYYLHDLQAPIIQKQRIWEIFMQWLKNIAAESGILFDEQEISEVIPRPMEVNYIIEMIKKLHFSNRGCTKEELAEEYGVSERTVKDTINKLNKGINGGIRIAGQKIDYSIQEKYIYDEKDKVTRRHFSGKSTMNPVFLQLNIAQVHSLLNGLKLSYYTEARNMAISSGVDIWSQLSEYTKKRIKVVYGAMDKELLQYLDCVEEAIAESPFALFRTEREQIREEDLTLEEIEELNQKLSM